MQVNSTTQQHCFSNWGLFGSASGFYVRLDLLEWHCIACTIKIVHEDLGCKNSLGKATHNPETQLNAGLKVSLPTVTFQRKDLAPPG